MFGMALTNLAVSSESQEIDRAIEAFLHQRFHVVEIPIPRHVKQIPLAIVCKTYQFTGSSIMAVGFPRLSGFIHVSAFAL